MPIVTRRRLLDAAPDPKKLYVVGALRRDNGRYRFVVRWLLGASDDPANQANDLPRVGDTFKVTIRKLTGDYLQVDGRQWNPTPYSFDKSPVPLAMIDPPRTEAVMPGQDSTTGRKWLLAQKPLVPVDPAVPNDSLRTQDGSIAMGVVHLLDHSDRTVVAHKVATLFAQALIAEDAQKESHISFFGLAERLQIDFGGSVDLVSQKLAELVMMGRPRPGQVVDRVAKHIEDLHAEISARNMTPDHTEFEGKWHLAGMFAAGVTNRMVLERAVALADEAERVRSQLRLRALQGGKMIDFWFGGAEPHPADGDRGRRFRASDLFGLGIEVGDFSEAEVNQWLALTNGSKDGVHIEVKHVPVVDPQVPTPSPSAARRASHTVQRLLFAQAVIDYGTGECLLAPGDIERAVQSGSSCPPLAPLEAFVNYDLTRKWVDPDKAAGMDASPLAYGTGDGRIEILIRKPDTTGSNGATNSVMGFNVYAVWEGASAATDDWFKGDEPRGIDDLKPWLVTRRFSLQRDLGGALPPSGGVTHPSLLAEQHDPAWHPAMVRASAIEDRTAGAQGTSGDNKLPNAILPGLTFWSLDLRRGMGAGTSSVTPCWDPGVPPATDWTPYYWRFDDPAKPSTRNAPQRYRFWVTSVDGLDQESAPVPVRTADAASAEAETHLFSPRNRTPLPFPAHDKDGAPHAITITADQPRQDITVGFSVPSAFHLGGQDIDGSTAPPIDPASLRAKVVLLRRQLVSRVDPAPLRAMALLPDDPILSSAAWQSAIAGLTSEGWSRFDARDGVPGADGRCEVVFPLKHFDRGFEYRALLGFAIAERLLPFWYPAVTARTVQSTKKVNDEFEAGDPATIAEAPAIGGVGQTTVLPLPNRAPPRDATPGAASMRWAKPVLPPPGVDRDRVLMRMVSNPVGPVDPSALSAPPALADWLGESLNLAQAYMAYCAMLRVAFQTGEEPSDEQWEAIRKWIAHDLLTPSTGLRQHGLVGFRGLMAINWNYVPLAKKPPTPPADPAADSEAEATQFRIFSARAPKVMRAATRPDIEVTVTNVAGTRCSFAAAALAPEVAALLKSGLQPVLVVVRIADVVAFGQATNFSGPSADQIDSFAIGAIPQSSTLPNTAGATCQLYFGVPMADIHNHHFGQEADALRSYVPVGGGPDEVMAWWIAPVSAQEVLSKATGWPSYLASLPASVQVSAPNAPIVRTVMTSDEPWLDDTVPAYWRPKTMTNATARFEARIFTMWSSDDFPEGSFVEVDRVAQRLGAAKRLLALADGYDEWTAIKAIEATGDGKPLDPASIIQVAKRWLLGQPVEPDPNTPHPPAPYVALASRPLLAATGLAKVEPSPVGLRAVDLMREAQEENDRSEDVLSKNEEMEIEAEGEQANLVATALPALIDYFASDSVNLMDSDFEYKYRIRVVQDIAPDAPVDWRYLRSEWSSFSPFVVPVRPRLLVTKAVPTSASIGLRPPAVEFHLETDANSGKATFYRVTIQRKVRAALLTTPDTQANISMAWRDIGSIIELAPGTVDTKVLRDDELERMDVLEPLSVEYRMRVMHYAQTDEGQRLLRKAPDDPIEFALTIPAPSATSLQEQMLIQKVTLE